MIPGADVPLDGRCDRPFSADGGSAHRGRGGEPEGDLRLEADLSEEDELVSEELAEIYLAQGLKEEAKAIYRKLSLLNPEKSIYFAELIAKLEKQ